MSRLRSSATSVASASRNHAMSAPRSAGERLRRCRSLTTRPLGPPVGDPLQRVAQPRAVEGPSVLAVADDLEEVPGGVLARRLDGGRRSFVLV